METAFMKKRAPRFVPGNCNYSLEVGKAAGFGPEVKSCSSRCLVSATAHFSCYSCTEPPLQSGVF